MNKKQLVISSLTVIVVASITATCARADDFEDLFSDDVFTDIDIDAGTTAASIFSLSHVIKQQSIISYNSDKDSVLGKRYSGLTGLSLSYQPEFQFQPNDVFSLSGEFDFTIDSIFWLRDEDWSDAVIDDRQYQFNIKELIAQARLSDWQFSTGVQRVALGMADILSVSNQLYAQNLSQPGLNDIDDTWQPAWTTMVSGSLAGVRVKAGTVHAHQLMAVPSAGSDFDTGITTMLEQAGLDYETEPLALKNMGWFGSVSGVLGPVDWQINAISQLSHSPVIDMTLLTSPAPMMMPRAVVYPRENTLAVAASYLTGPVLWKTEAAYMDGGQALSKSLALVDYSLLAGTFGLDYNPAGFGRFVAELQLHHVLDYGALDIADADNALTEDAAQWALMYSQSFLREQLDISAQMIAFDFDASGGAMQGISAEYAWNDKWLSGIKLVNFISGDSAFLRDAGDRDRLVLTLRYQF
jgi:hypothetical protein